MGARRSNNMTVGIISPSRVSAENDVYPACDDNHGTHEGGRIGSFAPHHLAKSSRPNELGVVEQCRQGGRGETESFFFSPQLRQESNALASLSLHELAVRKGRTQRPEIGGALTGVPPDILPFLQFRETDPDEIK